MDIVSSWRRSGGLDTFFESDGFSNLPSLISKKKNELRCEAKVRFYKKKFKVFISGIEQRNFCVESLQTLFEIDPFES